MPCGAKTRARAWCRRLHRLLRSARRWLCHRGCVSERSGAPREWRAARLRRRHDAIPGRSPDPWHWRNCECRFPFPEAPTILKIPVLPISYGDAQHFLAALGGRVAPPNWRGSLPTVGIVRVSLWKAAVAAGRACKDDVGLQADQLLRECSYPIDVTAAPTKVHPHVAAIGPTDVRKRLCERRDPGLRHGIVFVAHAAQSLPPEKIRPMPRDFRG